MSFLNISNTEGILFQLKSNFFKEKVDDKIVVIGKPNKIFLWEDLIQSHSSLINLIIESKLYLLIT